jgi:hypothetical protein
MIFRRPPGGFLVLLTTYKEPQKFKGNKVAFLSKSSPTSPKGRNLQSLVSSPGSIHFQETLNSETQTNPSYWPYLWR